jgi:hypothetical protein
MNVSDGSFSRPGVELTRIESGNGFSRKPSVHAVLADKSQKSLEKPLPFGAVGSRPVPGFGAESRQPDGNREGPALLRRVRLVARP